MKSQLGMLIGPKIRLANLPIRAAWGRRWKVRGASFGAKPETEARFRFKKKWPLEALFQKNISARL